MNRTRTQSNWEVALTPARPTPRRTVSGAETTTPSAPAHHLEADLIEAVEKLTDLARRIEAKVDSLDERLASVDDRIGSVEQRITSLNERLTSVADSFTAAAARTRASRRVEATAAAPAEAPTSQSVTRAARRIRAAAAPAVPATDGLT